MCFSLVMAAIHSIASPTLFIPVHIRGFGGPAVLQFANSALLSLLFSCPLATTHAIDAVLMRPVMS
jgi:hypothetical protein